MFLSFLPPEIQEAIANLNINFLNEIRLRRGQPVIIQYRGEYMYINRFGATFNSSNAIICMSADSVLHGAMSENVYMYAEQLKNGFITVNGGIRIGIAGEYVINDNEIVTVKNITSLNIRIPHDVIGAADGLYEIICGNPIKNTLIFSTPGFGKTTLLRDIARKISQSAFLSVLVFDERNEIAAADGENLSFDLGKSCDVVRGGCKLTAFTNSIRVMRPDVIITDELSGSNDIGSVKYAVECGITVIASSHTVNKEKLREYPFDIFAELSGIGKKILVYDKNFNIVGNCSSVGRTRNGNLG